jgi:DNA polymerase
VERPDSLATLRDAYKACRACYLGTTGARFVFGVGDEAAKVLIIGEAPGFHEDKQGEPFVGAAGKLLDELLGSIGLSRRPGGGAYIANVIKHRPPDNRDPQTDEIVACAPILDEQIRILDPAVIVTVGNFASKYVLETEAGITKIRGRVFHRAGRAVFPTFHPAAALRSTAVEAQLKSDFAALRRVLDDRLHGAGADEPAAVPPAAAEPPAPEVEQMNLFE